MMPEVKITKKAMVEIIVCGWNPEVCGESCIFLKEGGNADESSLTAEPFFICRLFKNHKKPKKFKNLFNNGRVAYRCKRCLKHFGKAAKILAAMQYHH